MSRPKALFILAEDSANLIYGPDERRTIGALVEVMSEPLTRESLSERRDLLRDVELIFSGWGAPRIDEEFLAAAPKLRAIFYASGSVAEWLTHAVWDRRIVVSSAYAANAIPVAEYTVSAIVFSLKHAWRLCRQTQLLRRLPDRNAAPGCYRSTVGLISMGVTGRAVRRLLRVFDLKVLAYDPYLTDTEAEALSVERVSLEEMFPRCDVVSLHTPLLAETRGMITGKHLAAMKLGATFINTARGEIVQHDELIDTALRREDLQFVLDVTDPEPAGEDSPLYTLSNVVITPHIAGSVGNECRRMGRYMVEELQRFLAGQPLQWEVTPELARNTCHRPVVKVNPHVLRAPLVVDRGLGTAAR